MTVLTYPRDPELFSELIFLILICEIKKVGFWLKRCFLKKNTFFSVIYAKLFGLQNKSNYNFVKRIIFFNQYVPIDTHLSTGLFRKTEWTNS